MDIGSNLIWSLEIYGTELALDLLEALAVIVADEISETRMGVMQRQARWHETLVKYREW